MLRDAQRGNSGGGGQGGGKGALNVPYFRPEKPKEILAYFAQLKVLICKQEFKNLASTLHT